MTVGSCFSGIGGFDKGFELVGCDVRWQVEIDPFCSRVLSRHWPGVTRYEDIKAFAWALEEARRCGVCFCGAEVRVGDESCPNCEVNRYLTPSVVGAFQGQRDPNAVAEAIWQGESLLSGRCEGRGLGAEQDGAGYSQRRRPEAKHLRSVWQDAATIQGWEISDSGAPSRLREAVRRAMALPAMPPQGTQAVSRWEELGDLSQWKVDVICGGFP